MRVCICTNRKGAKEKEKRKISSCTDQIIAIPNDKPNRLISHHKRNCSASFRVFLFLFSVLFNYCDTFRNYEFSFLLLLCIRRRKERRTTRIYSRTGSYLNAFISSLSHSVFKSCLSRFFSRSSLCHCVATEDNYREEKWKTKSFIFNGSSDEKKNVRACLASSHIALAIFDHFA